MYLDDRIERRRYGDIQPGLLDIKNRVLEAPCNKPLDMLVANYTNTAIKFKKHLVSVCPVIVYSSRSPINWKA